jgi:D-lactate dehydrogenase (cytochrome)
MSMPVVVTDPAVLAGYLTDASNVHGRADGLVRPRTVEEVAAVLAHAQEQGIPVLPVGSRTSTTAGAVPEGGWVMSMEAFDQLGEITVDQATADAGVILGDLQRAVAEQGRLYPPDPTSWNECTLGASIACNASGARTFRYGPTRAWVDALEVVLPTGTILQVRRGDPIPASWPAPTWRPPSGKNAAGIPAPSSLLDLFIGTEGTLGVITRATVRLTDAPCDVLGLLVWFRDRRAATAFVARAREAARADQRGALSPRCIEYFDAACLELARSRLGGVPEEARAGLFCEQEVEACGADAHLEAWMEAALGCDALVDDTFVAADAPTRQQLNALRHAIPAGINERVVRNGMRKVGTDLAVPDAALDEMMDAYEAAPGEHVLFGHIGDNHLHLNLLPHNADELQVALAYYDELARKAVALGGTVSAEHGIGKLKRKHLEWMVGSDVLASFRALKGALDPRDILARGNVLAPPAHL